MTPATPAPAAGTPEPRCVECGATDTVLAAGSDGKLRCLRNPAKRRPARPAETPPAAEPRESLPTHFPRHITRDGTAIYAPEHAPKPLSWGAAERAGGGTTEDETNLRGLITVCEDLKRRLVPYGATEAGWDSAIATLNRMLAERSRAERAEAARDALVAERDALAEVVKDYALVERFTETRHAVAHDLYRMPFHGSSWFDSPDAAVDDWLATLRRRATLAGGGE